MTRIVSRRIIRTEGPFPCSLCGTEFTTRRNRRRHGKQKHSKTVIMNYPSENQPKSSGESKASTSRSAAAAIERERQKEIEKERIAKLHEAKAALELARLTLQQQSMKKEIEFSNHHRKLYKKKQLCKRDPCTNATAQGLKNLPQSLQVRERAHFHHCQLCGEHFRQNSALRSHYTSIHDTKDSLAEAYRNTAARTPDEFLGSESSAIDTDSDVGSDEDNYYDSNRSPSPDRSVSPSGPTRL